MASERDELLELASLYKQAGDNDKALAALEKLDAMTPSEGSILDTLGGVAAQINQGLTFGLSDEIAGALSVINPLEMGEGYFSEMGDRYLESRDAARGLKQDFSQRNPVTAMALETGAGFGTGVASAPKLLAGSGLNLMRPMSREALTTSAKIGALEGGAYGYGVGEGDQGTLESMAEYGALGAVGGPLIDAAGAGLSSLIGAAGKRIGRTPQDNARAIVSKTLGFEDLDAASTKSALDELGSEGILADLGPNVRAVADVVASDAGQARAKFDAVLESRQMGQQGRIMEAAEGALGADPDAFRGTISQMSRDRFTKSQPLYAEAMEVQVQLTDDMRKVLERPSVQSAMGDVADIAAEEGIPVGMIDWEAPTMRQLDTLKKSLDKQIGIKRRAGDADAGRITRTKNNLLDEIDKQNPAYKEARSTWESDSKTLDAADMGRRIFLDDAEETAEAVKRMTQTEKDAYTMGAIKGVQDKVEASPDKNNAMRRIVSSPKLRNRLRNAFDSDDSFDEFMSAMEKEGRFAETRAGIGKGSQTSIRDQARKTMGLTGEGEGILGMAIDQARGNTGEAISKGARKLFRKSTIDSEVGSEVADILLNPNTSSQQLQDIFMGRSSGVVDYEKTRGMLGSLASQGSYGVLMPAFFGSRNQ